MRALEGLNCDVDGIRRIFSRYFSGTKRADNSSMFTCARKNASSRMSKNSLLSEGKNAEEVVAALTKREGVHAASRNSREQLCFSQTISE